MGIPLGVSGRKTENEARSPISLNLIRPFATLFERLRKRLYCTLKGILRKICSVPISLYGYLKSKICSVPISLYGYLKSKICSVPISLYGYLKRVFHRIQTIFYLSKPRKTAGPLLPLENPSPRPSDHPSLKQSLLISSSDADSQCQDILVFSDQCLEQTQEYPSVAKNIIDSVTISIPNCSNHALDYNKGSCTESSTDSAFSIQENVPQKIVSYAEHEETVICVSAGERCEESSDLCLEHNQEYPNEIKNIADSVTISIPNFSDRSLDYYAIINTDSAFTIQENVPQKNRSDAETLICNISTERKCEESSEAKQSEGEKLVIKSAVVVEKARWIKHYSSRHRILLVGEGDFSFSCSLAVAFDSASKMVATSLDSKAFLKKNYSNAPWNIYELKKRGCVVMHGIDATTMATHQLLEHKTFDRIIYNFPFAGFFKGLSRDSSLRRHRRLVSLFLKNAKEMIVEDGEIHISHKTNGYHSEWKVVSMASSHGLRLVEEVEFDLSDYPGYNTKRGFGGDENFNCYPSNTYKFGLKFVGV